MASSTTRNPWTTTQRPPVPEPAPALSVSARTELSSPWVRPTTQPAPEQPVHVAPEATGPVLPQAHVHPLEGGLPVAAPTATRAALWVVGAHGGAGESTLAALEDDWAASGHAWPVMESGTPAQCVVVARTSATGLLAARAALTQWAAAGTGPSARVVGLVLVADAPGKLPAALRDLAKVVAGGAPRVWEVPWIEAWRLGDPTPGRGPRALTKLLSDLRSLAPSAPVGDAPTKEENR